MKQLTEEQALRQIEELQAHIESVRKEKQKEHFPQRDERYHSPSIDARRVYKNDRFGYEYVFFNAVHRDEPSAKKHMEIIQYMVDLAREEEPLDWENYEVRRFLIVWDHKKNEPVVTFRRRFQDQGTFYLPSDAACQNVIDKFGDDLRVLFGMSLEHKS